jgi:hypothetical protein
MGIALALANKIRGNGCRQLVQYTKQEIEFSGLGAEACGYKINLGDFSNSVKITNTVTELMKALDNNQFLLCQQAHDKIASVELRDKCLKTRVMCIVGLTQLQALAAMQEPGKPLIPQIVRWMKEMNALVLRCMKSFAPEEKNAFAIKPGKEVTGWTTLGKGSADKIFFRKTDTIRSPQLSSPRASKKRKTVDKIMIYQGIDEADMNEAIKLLKQE